MTRLRTAAFALAALALAACGDADAPSPAPTPTAEPAPAADAGRQSVADVAAASPRLRTTARLLAAAGLDATLADTARVYTLFAPSDDAWAALGDDAVAALESDPAAARAALLAHVLGTRMLSFDVFPDLAIETEGGPELAFSEADGGLAVRGPAGTGRITDADLDADNGVVHIVDAVLAQ